MNEYSGKLADKRCSLMGGPLRNTNRSYSISEYLRSWSLIGHLFSLPN